MSDPRTRVLSEHANGEANLDQVDPPATYIAHVTTTEPARISPGRETKQATNAESPGTCHRTHPGEHSSQPKFLNSQPEWNPTGVLELDAQIQYQTNAVLHTPDWDPKKPGLICDLAMLYSHRFNSRGNLVDLSMWVEWQAKAYLLTPEHHTTKATLLSLLINSLCSRLGRLGHPADLNLAIWYVNQSMILTPDKRSQCEQGLLSQLGSLYFQRYMRLGNFNDLENAIVYQTEETLLIPDGHPSKNVSLENLGHLYYTRFNRLRTITDLDKAIEHYIKALSLLTQKDNRNKALSLGKVSSLFLTRFELLAQPADLDKAIEHQTSALILVPNDGSHAPILLYGLGILRYKRFHQLGSLDDLEKAIKHYTEAYTLMPDGHRAKPMALTHLGSIHWTQFLKLGELTNLDAAIECQTKQITLTPDGDPSKLSLLNGLCASVNVRFQRLGELKDLDTLIKYQTELLALGWPDKPTYLKSLGDLFSSRFQLRRDLADIETSIEHHAEAVLLTPTSHPAKPGRLSALGESFLAKYARQGKPAYIDASIEYLSEALRLTPEGCFDRSIRLNHLGKAFRGRFDVLGELKDLDKAIKYHTEAVLLIPDGHSDKPAGLSTLGVSHYTRFRRLGEFTDLNAALKYYTEAVQLTPDQHPGKPGRLNHLGGALLVRFRRLGELTDMNTALEHLTKAVQLTPDGDPGLPTYLNRIGFSLHARFHKSNNSADLESAIDYHRKAVHLLPDDDPTAIERLRNLGMSHLCRFERLKNQVDFVEAMGYFRRAANSSTASPSDKIMLAALWAFSSQHDLPGCIEAYGYAVRFIPQVAWLGLTVDRRYEELATWATLPSQAAATAIQSKEYTLALEWLEECRSVVWSQMLQLRNPLDQLRSVDAQLADDLKQVAGVLDSIGLSNPYQSNALDSQISIERTAREYRSHASRWEDLVGKARRVPGLERFLLPKKLSELTKSTYNGTVVTINVHDSRCDALALRPGSSEVVHIPLLSISRNQCIDMRNRLYTALRENNIRARGLRRPVFETREATDIFKDVLATLWADVVRPILDTLGLLKNAEYRELPLVAWCCTGPLAFLPLHAAGYYSEPRERTFDYVVSSYTPTLGALLKSSPAPDEFGGILAVGQASQFSYAPLPGTVTELDVIQKQAKNLKFTRIVEEDATPGAVLTAMQQHSWIHLACHASQDISDPTTSAFQLHGGNLDLATITRKPLPNAELAFLSACETATGDEKTPDEAVHLAAGMLMSGYRTVIATMWSIRDEDAPVIAEHFYSRLFEGEIPNSGKAAQSLHDAVGHLRATIGEKEFSRWVPYIHMGQ